MITLEQLEAEAFPKGQKPHTFIYMLFIEARALLQNKESSQAALPIINNLYEQFHKNRFRFNRYNSMPICQAYIRAQIYPKKVKKRVK